MTDRWLAVSLPAPAPGEALLLVEALRRLGARTVEREDDSGEAGLVALFPAPADPDRLVSDIVIAARANTTLGTVAPRWRWLDREEWDARWGGGHAPRRVSDRLVVVVGEAHAGPHAGPPAIRLSPSSAFGTAEHATTRACLRMLDAAVREGDRVLDVGSGSGVLAIAAVVLGAAAATALESDPVACAAARRNATMNDVADRVHVREAVVAPGSLRGRARSFDGIVANIGADVLRPLLSDLSAALVRGGWLVLGGATPRERDEVVDAARGAGLEVVEEEVLEGWWTVRLRRAFGPDGGES